MCQPIPFPTIKCTSLCTNFTARQRLVFIHKKKRKHLYRKIKTVAWHMNLRKFKKYLQFYVDKSIFMVPLLSE